MTEQETKTDTPKTESIPSTEEPTEEQPVEEQPAEEPAAEAAPDTGSTDTTKEEAAIIRQVEYYFGDANLFRDKFLKAQIAKDDGWVPLDILLKFNRLKSLSEDKKVIVDALEKSDEGLLEISEDREKIRRHPERPLPEMNEEVRKERVSRTVYVKGFAAQDGTHMNELVEFFEPYEKVVNIVMRKYLDKTTKKYLFKGSVFVTFAKKEQCTEFLAKEKMEYKGKQLLRMMEVDYFAVKDKERQERDARRQKKEKAKEEETAHLPKQASVFVDSIGADTTRESIKATIQGLGEGLDIAFIDFKKTDPNGYVRFSTEGAGKLLLEKLTDGKLKLDDVDVPVRLLEGDEETEYLRKVVRDQKARRNPKGKGHQHRGHNDRSHDRKRKHENAGKDDESATKKAAK